LQNCLNYYIISNNCEIGGKTMNIFEARNAAFDYDIISGVESEAGFESDNLVLTYQD